MDDYDSPRGKKGGSSWLLYTLVLGAVGGGIYYMWNGGFDIKKAQALLDNKTISSGISSRFGKTPDTAKTVKEKADALIKSGIDFAVEKPKEIAGNFLGSIAETARTEAAKALGLSAGGGGGGGGGGGSLSEGGSGGKDVVPP